MANDYLTLLEFKQALADTSWTPNYDTIIEAIITRASRAIDRTTRRHPGAYYASTDETRYFDGSGTSSLWTGEMAAAPTTVRVAETGDLSNYTSWSSTDYIVWPYNAPYMGEPYLRLDIDILYGSKVLWYKYRKAVEIAGKFGFSTTVPDDIKQIALIQSVRWFKRAQQAFRDTGAIVDLGQLTYTQQLDPEVAGMLENFRRVAV